MDEINLADYLYVLKRRKRTVLGILVAVMIISGIVFAIMPRTYQGKATLLFPERRTNALSSQLASLVGGIPLLGESPSLAGRNVCITVLRSRTVNENICKRLNLNQYGLTYKDLQENLYIETPKEGGLNITCEVPTSWLKGHISKSEVGEAAARLAADIANCYLSELQLFDQMNSRLLGRTDRMFFESQLQRSKNELAKAEERLEKFQKANPTLMPPDKASLYANQALELASQQIQAEIALQEAQGQIARARATWTAGAPSELSPEAVMDNPVISELKANLAKLEVRRATLLEDFTENHPDVVALDQEIKKTYDRIQEEVSHIIAGKAGSTSPAHQELVKQLVLLEINGEGLESRKSALNSALAKIERQLSNLPPLEVEYGRLLRDLKAAETVYMTLLAEYAKARVNEERDAESFIVVDKPVVPTGPAKPSVKLFFLASLVLGLFGGVFIAVVQEGFAGTSGEFRKAKGIPQKQPREKEV